MSGSSVKSQFPAVRVVCKGQNLESNASIASFPNIPSQSPAVDFEAQILSSHPNTIPPWDKQNKTNNLNFQWVNMDSLSASNHSVSIGTGSIIRLSTSDSDHNYAAACSIDARWIPGTIASSFPSPFRATPLDNSITAPGYFSNVGTFFFNQNPRPPRITFDPPFLESINFATSLAASESDQQISSIESLILAAGIIPTANTWITSGSTSMSLHYLEHVLASILVDSISRVGSYRSYDTTGDAAAWPLLFYNSSLQTDDFHHWQQAGITPNSTDNLTIIHMKQTVTGYGYQLSDTSQYFAIILLAAHLFLALGHTIIIMIEPNRSSGCWDSISELVVLAQQSPRSDLLRNTCAGIDRIRTFGHKVRVVNAKEDLDSLELRFYSKSEAKTLKDSEVIPGHLYGQETAYDEEVQHSINDSAIELSPLLEETRAQRLSITHRNVHTF